jgi:hypothetical protein
VPVWKTLEADPEKLYRKAETTKVRLSLNAEYASPVSAAEVLHMRHPEEMAAYERMTTFSGIDAAITKFADLKTGKIQEVRSNTQRIRVSEKQLVDLHEIWNECLERSDVGMRPILFVGGPGLEAFSYWIEEPHVVLNGMLVSLLTPQETMFVMARELGRIRMGVLPHSMLAMSSDKLVKIVDSVTMGIGGLITRGLKAVVMDWYRKLDFTLDRFGYRVCQDQGAAFMTLLKLSSAPIKYYNSLSWEAFVEQGEAFLKNSGSGTLGKFMNLGDIHQWPAIRAVRLREWINNPGMQSVADCREPVGTQNTDVCVCGMRATGGDAFCTQCGAPRQSLK